MCVVDGELIAGEEIMDTLRLAAERAAQQKYKKIIVFSVLLLLGMNYLLFSFFRIPGLQNYVRLGIAAVMALHCLLRLLAKDLQRKDFVLMIGAAALLITDGAITFNLTFLLVLTIVLRSVSFEDLLGHATTASTILLMVVLVSLTLGVVDNSLYSVGDRHRITMGFANVNGTSVFAFSIMLIFFLSVKKVQGTFSWVYIASVLVVYILTNSRTMLMAAVALFVAWLLLERLPKRTARMVVFAVAAVMFVFPFIWGLPFLSNSALNRLLSIRPHYYYEYIKNNPLPFFLFGGSKAVEIDNTYLLLLYNCGIMGYAAIAAITVVALDSMVRGDRYREVCFCIAMLVYGQLEGTLVRPEILCVPVFWICIIKGFTKNDLIITAKDVGRWITLRYHNFLKGKNKEL